ncbi:hypothetical protein Pan241w_53060 [Gimesia alba]|uniref:Uncharacterized protein n=1 Tax=Gimesia alba TaxID=2527973 RepID=A0A517RMS4_9PLAN|nr:hypothetical protein Pan241w_53060 [Gimesia alba]
MDYNEILCQLRRKEMTNGGSKSPEEKKQEQKQEAKPTSESK